MQQDYKNNGARIILGTLSLFLIAPHALAKEKPETPRPVEELIAEQTQVFSLKEALALAYSGNPRILAARAELFGAHEALPQAMAGWKPRVDAAGDVTAVAQDSDPGDEQDTVEKGVSVTLTQPLYSGGSTFAATDSAKDAIKAQRAVLSAIEQDVLLDAVTAYMDVVRDESLLLLVQNNRDLIAQQLEATRARFEVGELTRTDVSQAEARLAEAESRIISARADLRSSYAFYEQVIGITPRDVRAPAIELELPETLDQAKSLTEEQNPEIIAAEYIYNAALDNVEDIFGELLPQIGLEAGWSRTDDPRPGTLDRSSAGTIGLKVTVPLYESGATRSRIRQAKYAAMENRYNIREQKRRARENVIRAWENLAAARAEIESRKAQVRAAEVARKGVQEETEVGARTVLDALDADQELLDARTALVIARANEIVSAHALARAIGVLIPENVGFTVTDAGYDAHLERAKRKIFDLNVEEPVGQLDGEL